ncbi:MAG: lipid-A-disaccharide synthase N-terminal domain-containing protein [Phycisphaerales bacterium]
MKPGPIVAMVALLLIGMWLVLQPTLSREHSDFNIRIGAIELKVTELSNGQYQIVGPERVASTEMLDAEGLQAVVQREQQAWRARPKWERTLLGFFNITSWVNFTWVAVGLAGQAAFFGRMFVQWIVSEKSRQSQVPELFWWLSFLGGMCLFTYFVWRVDVVGVLGQSTGIVIYARNLRLIHKQKKRELRAAARAAGAVADPAADPAPEPVSAGAGQGS